MNSFPAPLPLAEYAESASQFPRLTVVVAVVTMVVVVVSKTGVSMDKSSKLGGEKYGWRQLRCDSGGCRGDAQEGTSTRDKRLGEWD